MYDLSVLFCKVFISKLKLHLIWASYFWGNVIVLSPVVQMLDSVIHLTNHYIQWISIRKTNWVIHWIDFYLMDSAIQRFNNQGRKVFLFLQIAFSFLVSPGLEKKVPSSSLGQVDCLAGQVTFKASLPDKQGCRKVILQLNH